MMTLLTPLPFVLTHCLAWPGLLHAFKLGNVALANVPGSGVADDKSVYAYVPGHDSLLSAC